MAYVSQTEQMDFHRHNWKDPAISNENMNTGLDWKELKSEWFMNQLETIALDKSKMFQQVAETSCISWTNSSWIIILDGGWLDFRL